MIRTVTATEAKAQLLALLDDAAAGEEVLITKHGRVVARLVPATGPHALRARFSGLAVGAVAEDQLFGTDEAWHAG